MKVTPTQLKAGTHKQENLSALGVIPLALLISVGQSYAEETKPEPAYTEINEASEHTYWGIQIENDVFTIGNDDKYYTSGIQLSWLEVGETSSIHDRLYPLLFGKDTYELSGTEYSIGQKIFTPKDTSLTTPDPTDRPYAGWLYYNMSAGYLAEQNDYLGILHFIDFTIGIIGPSSQAEEMQRGWHEVINNDDVNGWNHQLEDELGLNFTSTTKWRLHPKRVRGVSYDITPHAVIALGNVYTYGGGGVMFRFGENLNDDLGPPSIRPGFPGSAGFGFTSRSSSWYVYAGHESRVVLRNIFLDGNTFASSPSVERELLVGDFLVGFVYRNDGWRFSIANMWRSKEFEGQEDMTNYGAVTFSFIY